MGNKPKFKFKLFEKVWLKDDLFPETIYVILERGINQYKQIKYAVRKDNGVYVSWIDESNLEKIKSPIQRIKEKLTNEK